MSPESPLRRHHTTERPAKRSRLSHLHNDNMRPFGMGATPSTPPRRHVRNVSRSRVNSSQTKRKRNIPTPSSCRKRRRSTRHDDENAPLSDIKKARLFQPDVEMQDAAVPVKETPSKRKRNRILKDVLRSEKISRAALRNLNVNNIQPNPPHKPTPPQPQAQSHNSVPMPRTEHTAETSRSQRRLPRRFSEDSVVLTGEEQVEEVDISQCSEAEKQCMRETEHNEQDPLQAHLMDDGRCFVRIVRADGAVDYYTLYPHNEAQYHYYEDAR